MGFVPGGESIEIIETQFWGVSFGTMGRFLSEVQKDLVDELHVNLSDDTM